MGWLLGLLACASLAGLRELDELPASFPLALHGEVGTITTPKQGGQVSVDVVFEDQHAAEQAASELRSQAEALGYQVVDQEHTRKRDTVRLNGPGGRIEVGCCPQRADRMWLVLVTWFEATPSDL